jgi:hypothetical protein
MTRVRLIIRKWRRREIYIPRTAACIVLLKENDGREIAYSHDPNGHI